MVKKPGFAPDEFEIVCRELRDNYKQLLDITIQIQAAYGKTSKLGKEANATSRVVLGFLENFKNNG